MKELTNKSSETCCIFVDVHWSFSVTVTSPGLEVPLPQRASMQKSVRAAWASDGGVSFSPLLKWMSFLSLVHKCHLSYSAHWIRLEHLGDMIDITKYTTGGETGVCIALAEWRDRKPQSKISSQIFYEQGHTELVNKLTVLVLIWSKQQFLFFF